ncbi:MAG: CHASE2 domain-containing protein, partial [Cyanobacteria bacterium P01_H01_bin.121]
MSVSRLVTLNLGSGSFEAGFPSITAQLQEDGQTATQVVANLPAAPQLAELYRHWQRLYNAVYATGIRSHNVRRISFEFDADEEVTNVSDDELADLCQGLQQQLNQWLDKGSFGRLERVLRSHLSVKDPLCLVIVTESDDVRRFPWHLWHILDDYPQAEITLSTQNYSKVQAADRSTAQSLRVLAILGHSAGIDVQQDQQLLQQLVPQAVIEWLIEPDREALNTTLWDDAGWDLLFFAGHSQSSRDGTSGQIALNPTTKLTIQQLRYALKNAIARGLQLAIFNSCDGLGLARSLADLSIPHLIVMREPIPDRVAQEFLKGFLAALAQQQPFQLATRSAREKLQGLEDRFPCASWLPVACHNPLAPPFYLPKFAEREPALVNLQSFRVPTPSKPLSTPAVPALNLRSLQLQPDSGVTQLGTPIGSRPQFSRTPTKQTPHQSLRWYEALLGSIGLTIIILIIRLMGGLQGWELKAFDTLMRWRPPELPDSRLILVTITEADIQNQGPERGGKSLSDTALSQLLTTLNQAEPRVIGLDIYRDFPAHDAVPQLQEQLQTTDNLIVACQTSDSTLSVPGIAPPPEVPASQIGFADFAEDPDGVLRRQILSLSPEPTSPCSSRYSLNLHLALQYLEAEQIQPEFTPKGNLKLGDVVFQPLEFRSGGYQNLHPGGHQILLNYRALPTPTQIADHVTLTDLLEGQVNSDAFRDRIVLIGTVAQSSSDYWLTPYSQNQTFAQQTPGVMLHAQMASQVVSAVLDDRPMLKTWNPGLGVVWIAVWGVLPGLVIYGLSRQLSTHRLPIIWLSVLLTSELGLLG